MNISGVRTDAGFYDYNSIKINELKSQQAREPENIDNLPSGQNGEDSRQELKQTSADVSRETDHGAAEFAGMYQPDAVYELKGVDSDISKLDIEKALSDMKKDRVLQQYQFFVGENQQTVDEPLSHYREDENFWL